jgi:hypothetical protein
MSRDERDEARKKKLHDVVSRAADYIIKAQSTQGGWYRTSKAEGHDFARISSTSIQVQALQMAGMIGVPVNSSIMADAQAYLKTEVEKRMKESKPLNPRQAADLAAAIVCRSDPFAFFDQDGASVEWFRRCGAEMPRGADVKIGRDEFAHFCYAQALYNRMLNESAVAGLSWSDYRTTTCDFLRRSQSKEGSWSGSSENVDTEMNIGAGPSYSTAVWCVVLQFDKKRHPLTQARQLNTL